MKLRRSNTKPTTTTAEAPLTAPDPADLALMREELVHALVRATDDPVLTAKYERAIAAGMTVPDLSGVPKFRRLDVIDTACTDHLQLCDGGPCAICGSQKPRFGPDFATLTGELRACGWCLDRLQSYGGPIGGQDHLREIVAHALMGTRGLPPQGSRFKYSHPDNVPFFHEVGGGDGTPWAHIRNDAHRMQVLRNIALKKFHPITGYCRTQGQCDAVSIPGIVTTPWREEDIPKPEQKFIPISRRGAALEEENRRAYEQLRKERKRLEQNQERRLAALRERDNEIAAHLASLPEEERREYLEAIQRPVLDPINRVRI